MVSLESRERLRSLVVDLGKSKHMAKRQALREDILVKVEAMNSLKMAEIDKGESLEREIELKRKRREFGISFSQMKQNDSREQNSKDTILTDKK